MKKLITVLLIVIVAVTLVFIFERVSKNAGFGPTAMLIVSFLGGLIFLFLATLLLYETRFRETLTKFWLVAISIFMTFLFVEITTTIFLIKPLSPPLIPDNYRHHKLVPNTSSYFDYKEFSYVQRVNNLGLRGRDVQIKKSPNLYRILMLGDSMTMGKGVEDDQTFSVLLEESLNQRRTKGKDKIIEVLNAGVDGYAPILSFIQLTRDLAPLEPDMVVLNMDMNDLVGESVFRKQAVYGSDGELIGVASGEGKLSLSERIQRWSERNLYLTRLIIVFINKLFNYKEFTVRRIVTQTNFELLKHTLAEDTDNRKEQWQNLFDSVLRIKKYCDDKEIKFLLTIYPQGHQVNEREYMPGRYKLIPKNATVSDKSVHIIQEFATNNNIHLINQFSLFRSYNGKPLLYYSYDGHWTSAGQKLMASGLEQHLQDDIGRTGAPEM